MSDELSELRRQRDLLREACEAALELAEHGAASAMAWEHGDRGSVARADSEVKRILAKLNEALNQTGGEG